MTVSNMYAHASNVVRTHIHQADDLDLDDPFTPACLTSMKELWLDEAIQAAILRGGEFALHDNIQ